MRERDILRSFSKTIGKSGASGGFHSFGTRVVSLLDGSEVGTAMFSVYIAHCMILYCDTH